MTRDKSQIDIDAMLRERGARWRSVQPAPPPAEWSEGGSNRHGSWLAGAAAAVLLLFVAANGLMPRAPAPASGTTPAPSAIGGDETSPTHIREGDAVVASGRILLAAGSAEPVLCEIEGVPYSYPPHVRCPRVQVGLTALDRTSLPGWDRIGDAWMSAYLTISGFWRGGNIEVANVVASAPAPSPRLTVPCSAGELQQPGNGDNAEALEASEARLRAEIEAHRDLFSGLWSAEIETGGPPDRALVVGSLGDLAEARAMLATLYPFNLCVTGATYGRNELDSAAGRLAALDDSWQVSLEPPYEKVRVQLAILDAETATLLEPYRNIVEIDQLVTLAP